MIRRRSFASSQLVHQVWRHICSSQLVHQVLLPLLRQQPAELEELLLRQQPAELDELLLRQQPAALEVLVGWAPQ